MYVDIFQTQYSKFSLLNPHFQRQEYFHVIAFHLLMTNVQLIDVDMFLVLHPIHESYNLMNRIQYVSHQTKFIRNSIQKKSKRLETHTTSEYTRLVCPSS